MGSFFDTAGNVVSCTTVSVSVWPEFEIVEGAKVKIVGKSKGRGFTGVMKRHNFKGGHRSHGKSDQLRAAGSIGASSDPSRVLPGVKMAGRHGGTQITTRNLKIVRVDAEKNLIMVRGAVPGSTSSLVYITK